MTSMWKLPSSAIVIFGKITSVNTSLHRLAEKLVIAEAELLAMRMVVYVMEQKKINDDMKISKAKLMRGLKGSSS